MSKKRFGAVLFCLLIVLAFIPATLFGQSVEGKWIKQRKNIRLAGNSLVIDLKKKLVSFGYRGYGRVVLKIKSVTKDDKVDMPRYKIKTVSRLGKVTLTVLAFGAKKIYLGHSRMGKIKIWGAYIKK